MGQKRPDWQALGALFDQPPFATPQERPRRRENGQATYCGEPLPRWLIRDLMQERAAIREFDGVMPRAEAERLTREDLEE